MTFQTGIPFPLSFGFVSWAMFGAGAALVSIPIIIHILNRRRFKVVTWAAMEFLLRAMRKNRRRLEFEQWLLLATRCLLIFLLGAALARPMGCNNSALAGRAGRTGFNVIVVDNSYSMAYEANRPGARTHLDQAKKIAHSLISHFSPGGESVVLITTASPVRTDGPQNSVARPGYNLNSAEGAVDRIEQSYSGTDLLGALKMALQIGREETREQNKSLYLITDATRSAWEPQAQALRQLGPDLAKAFKITHFNLTRARPQTNNAVLDVYSTGGLVRTGFPPGFLASAKSYGPQQAASLQWKVDEQSLDPVEVKLDPDAQPIGPKTQPQFTTGGPHVITASLASSGDRLPIDNTRYHVEDVSAELRVLLVEGKRGAGVADSSGSALQAALSPTHTDPNGKPLKSLSNFVTEPISDLELGNRVLNEYGAVVLADVSQVTVPEADRLRQFVEHGGTLEIFMGDSVNRDAYNNILLPRKLLPGPLIKLVTTGTDQQAYRFNFKPTAVQNEYLEAFQNLDNSGLDLVETRSYFQVEIPPKSGVTRVLDYLPRGTDPAKSGAAGDPAITVQTLGEGRVVFVATTANGEWNEFPPHQAYLPLMQELLAHSVKSGTYWMNVEVGQPVTVPSNVKLTAAPSLLDPNKKPVVIESVTLAKDPASTTAAETVYRSVPLKTPGIYTLSLGASNVPVAVNVPAGEADIRTINDQAVKKSLGDIDLGLEGDAAPSDSQISQAGRDWGWDLMLAVLVLLGLEAFMAMKFGHYKQIEAKR